MRTYAKLLGLASIFSAPYFVRAEDDEDLDDEEAGSGDVLKLTSDTFDDVVGSTPFVLVKFYAPWCGHCKAMAPEYEKAAKVVKADPELSNVVLADVDATVETELGAKYDVQGYPSIFWFVNGNKREYAGPRTSEGIVEWIKANMGPTLQTMTADEAKAAVETRKPGEAYIVFEGDKTVQDAAGEVAEMRKGGSFYVYVKGSSSKSIVHRGTAETHEFTGEHTVDALKEWLEKERTPHFGQITEDNFEIYMEHAKNGLFWVCLSAATLQDDLKKYSPDFVKAYQAQSGDVRYPFVWLDVAEFEAHAKEELGCSTFPTIVLQRGDLLGDRAEAKVEKFVRSFADNPKELNAAAVKTFFADIESGALEPVEEPDELDALDDEEDDDDDDEADDSDGDEMKEDL